MKESNLDWITFMPLGIAPLGPAQGQSLSDYLEQEISYWLHMHIYAHDEMKDPTKVNSHWSMTK